MMKDLKFALYDAAISATAGIAPTAAFGFAAAPVIAALWRALGEVVSETLPDGWRPQYRPAFHPVANRVEYE